VADGVMFRPAAATQVTGLYEEHNQGLALGDADTRHEAVNHTAEDWARGDIHTNSAESFLEPLKTVHLRCVPHG